MWPFRSAAGVEPGDYCPDDAIWDETADLEEGIRIAPFVARAFALSTPLLDSATRADGYIVGGRIIWKKLLAGLFAPSEITYVPGYETRGAAVMAVDLAAVLWHHTAGRPSAKNPSPSKDICINGRKAGKGTTAVSGPLVQLLVDLNGHVWVICSGRANHAGTGHRPLEALMHKGMWPIGTAKDQGLKDTGGWGGVLFGVEIENDGASPFTQAQISTCVRIGLAAKRLGMSDAQAIGWDHQACTARKVDLPAATHQSIITAFLLAVKSAAWKWKQGQTEPVHVPPTPLTPEIDLGDIPIAPPVDPKRAAIIEEIAALRATTPPGPMSAWRKGEIAKLEAQLKR